jgi:hypothetical protein
MDYDPKHPDGLSKRTELDGVPFKDLANLKEDDRIDEIAKKAMFSFGTVGFLVDCGPEYEMKGDRYIRKLKEKYPKITVLERKQNYPVKDVETIVIKYGD